MSIADRVRAEIGARTPAFRKLLPLLFRKECRAKSFWKRCAGF